MWSSLRKWRCWHREKTAEGIWAVLKCLVANQREVKIYSHELQESGRGLRLGIIDVTRHSSGASIGICGSSLTLVVWGTHWCAWDSGDQLIESVYAVAWERGFLGGVYRHRRMRSQVCSKHTHHPVELLGDPDCSRPLGISTVGSKPWLFFL